ncbi:MAG: hypothetical protein WCJ72_13625 [Chryseobacterium sp.]
MFANLFGVDIYLFAISRIADFLKQVASILENMTIPHWELIPKCLMDIKIGCPGNCVSEYFVLATDVVFYFVITGIDAIACMSYFLIPIIPING